MGGPAADDPRPVPELLAATVALDDDDERAWLAIRALHHRGTREAPVALLTDRCEDARHETTAALAYRRDPRALGPLIAALEAEPGSTVMDAAVLYLGGDEEGRVADEALLALEPGDLAARLRASRAG